MVLVKYIVVSVVNKLQHDKIDKKVKFSHTEETISENYNQGDKLVLKYRFNCFFRLELISFL